MKTPLYMAFRLWFQANMVNSILVFLWFAKDGIGGALMIMFCIFLLGLVFTLLLVPFIHLLNRFVMGLNYGFGIRFFTLLLFQSALAILFWICFYWIFGFNWYEPDGFFRYLMLSSVTGVALTVLFNWGRFCDLDAEVQIELLQEPERIDVP